LAHKPLVFHRLAEREIRSARKWYRERSVDAPRKFREEIDVAVAKVIQLPADDAIAKIRAMLGPHQAGTESKTKS
jgi:hypothetical protein